MAQGWQFWIDRGGTFTDVIGCPPGGDVLITHKLLSVSPDRYDDAAIQGMREILGLRKHEAFANHLIERVHMGTTVGTNALLEGKGTPALLVTTKGFADHLSIGYQTRPELFALNIQKPKVFYQQVVEVSERMSVDGQVLCRPDPTEVRKQLKEARALGLKSCAIHFLHSYRFSGHERLVAEIAREVGFSYVVTSSQLSPLKRFVPRGHTVTLEAMLGPVVRTYTEPLTETLHQQSGHTANKLFFMKSSGGLATSAAFSGKDSVLSGPAGGVLAMQDVAKRTGHHRWVSFDMGGTSTDVAHYDGQLKRDVESKIAGQPVQVPSLSMHTIAAGGGSKLVQDGTKQRVGPESAGSLPGPACYGLGGPLTVTDAQLLLGRLQAKRFPRVFGKTGKEPLNLEASRKLLREQLGHMAARDQTELPAPDKERLSPAATALLAGYLRIAAQNMAQAVRKLTLEQGVDVRDHRLLSFGGAAGQIVCQVADELAMQEILVHPCASVLSAFGIGRASLQAIRQKTLDRGLQSWNFQDFQKEQSSLMQACMAELRKQLEIKDHQIERVTFVRLRYEGSDHGISLRCEDQEDWHNLAERFTQEHQNSLGYAHAEVPIICADLSCQMSHAPSEFAGAVPAVVSLSEYREQQSHQPNELPKGQTPELQQQTASCYMQGRWQEVRLVEMRSSDVGDGSSWQVSGPALVVHEHATYVVESGWVARRDEQGFLHLKRTSARRSEEEEQDQRVSAGAELELMQGALTSIAEEMGVVLKNSAFSVNIKERLDFSCALFDANGELIVNAPHIPVHLGAMGETVKSLVRARKGELRPGDVWVSNDPYSGGSHLPDITMISPVFSGGGEDIRFFVASRGHHADVGGVSPGSMPAQSTHLSEEGVCIKHECWSRSGEPPRIEYFRSLLGKGAYPARNPDQNIADLQAQAAANTHGVRALAGLVKLFGEAYVEAKMGEILAYTEERMRHCLQQLHPGSFCLPLDDGQVIQVDLQHVGERLRVDFTGTSSCDEGNLNAPLAVTKSAVMFAFRCLLTEAVPLNAGCLRAIDLVVPKESLLDPVYPRAVVGGNVETSQNVVDALFLAMGVQAASQGTMNNLSFGDAHHQYYETICGGSGAGAEYDGCDAVHSHMTNSSLTDPEVLEQDYPVRLESFCIRKASGGEGLQRGGHGVERTFRFLKDIEVSLLASRRRISSFGLNGGLHGKSGQHILISVAGERKALPGKVSFIAKQGERLTILTPGGGGYGPPGGWSSIRSL